jgi:nicotinamidase-related amidase
MSEDIDSIRRSNVMAIDMPDTSRRRFLTVTGVSTAAAFLAPQKFVADDLVDSRASDEAIHPIKLSLALNKAGTAVVFIDPQNDVLSESGHARAAVSERVKENKMIENTERIFKATKSRGFEVFISPTTSFLKTRDGSSTAHWKTDEASTNLFGRTGRLSLDGLKGSGADWLERFKPYIEDGKTIVVSPHRVWGPQTNDLVLQLRKRKISKIILGGMLANICVESHLREFLEQGFEVAQ